ncbi:MAG: spondin domain-containing protein, partial [Planctomycetota bacterium JB042]
MSRSPVPPLAVLVLASGLATAGDLPATDAAEYRVTFLASWSATTHPTDFPTGSAHFSGLVGATHDAQVSFWAPGQLASPGIESMAETGSKSLLLGEVAAAFAAGSVESALSGGGIGPSPGSVAMTFSVSQSHPRVTLVSMIAPSPDWFVGVHDLDLFAGGDWVDLLAVPLAPYDAGTDDGPTFLSPNADTNPARPIAEITGHPFTGTPPLGRFLFERIDAPAPPFVDLGGALAGTNGPPALSGAGSLEPGTTTALALQNGLAGATAALVVGSAAAPTPFLGGTLVPTPDVVLHGLALGPAGDLALSAPWPSGVPAASAFVFQLWIADPAGPFG